MPPPPPLAAAALSGNSLIFSILSPAVLRLTALTSLRSNNPSLSLHFSISATATATATATNSFTNANNHSLPHDGTNPSIHYDSLRALQWDKLCDSVASFARTSPGRQATKAHLWSLNRSYQESLTLLDETNAAIEMHKHGGCSLDFSGIDLLLVESAIQSAQRSLAMNGNEAVALAGLLEFSDMLQFNLKAAIKEDAEWHTRFMPLTEVIMGMVVNQSLIKLILKVVDDDGSVKDSASQALRRSRDQVRLLERKLYQLMDSLVRSAKSEISFLEVRNVDGRWCIKSEGDQLTDFKGLLISSGAGNGTILEPLSAVPLNDELQQARASVLKAEEDVLRMLTEKVRMDLECIEILVDNIIKLDVINARASYGLSFGATCPSIFLPEGCNSSTADAFLSGKIVSESSCAKEREWMLYLPNAQHPLLLQQYRENLENAKRDVRNASAEIRIKQPGGNMSREVKKDIDISSLKMKVKELEQARPVPVDFLISQRIRVLVITGPNTGGKTVCLKTIGLAAMMAKSGLHVLASESVKIPWFDSVFADIGDDQSLTQSLSTFSGHLKKISEIQSVSTSQSLVLLDEVGAGTNPIEGAALGMSLLESFAESGASLTIATTHHGELKTLKYSHDVFENACAEFDEVNLKPTYKILWGVPGRSNAINIAERLGLPNTIVDDARKHYGSANAQIDEVINDMECIKKNYEMLMQEAQNQLRESRHLYEKMLLARRKIMEHSRGQRLGKMHEVSKAAAMARSGLHKKVRQLRASSIKSSASTTIQSHGRRDSGISNKKLTTEVASENSMTSYKRISSIDDIEQPTSDKPEFPRVGDTVYVSSFGKKVTVINVERSKGELVVQVGSMKLKVKLSDISK